MKTKIKQLLSPIFTRRDFIKSSSAVGGLAVAASSLSLPFKAQASQPIANEKKKKSSGVPVPLTVVAAAHYACILLMVKLNG